jgi:membrane-associated protease RseP (regulator of RpoE activity)
MTMTAGLAYAAKPCTPFAPRDAQQSYPFEIVSNKPIVQIRVNGSKAQPLMLDTGSAASLIDPTLAKSLGFQPESQNDGFFGVGSKKSSLTLLKPPACLEMAGAHAEVRLLGFDLSLISSVEGTPVRGTLGGEFLKHFVVVIDYAKKTLRVLDPSFEYHGDGIVLPVTIDRQIFTTARIHKSSGETVEGKFYVDTGTRTALSLNSPFVRDHHLLEGETAIPVATLGVGMGGESLATVYRVRELELGPLHLSGVVATASHDEKGVFADPNVAGIIGGELLRKFTVILDYPHQRVILEKGPQSDTPFGYDASGLFLLAEGTKLDRIKVLRVVDGSPASEAGLQKDDVIETIDGKPAHNLEHVRQLFRSEGQTYALRIRRDGKSVRASIRTEDLLGRAGATKRM